jgi:hypothetical protein
MNENVSGMLIQSRNARFALLPGKYAWRSNFRTKELRGL